MTTLALLSSLSLTLAMPQGQGSPSEAELRKEMARLEKEVKGSLVGSGGDWKKSTMTPAKLAQLTGNAVKNLRAAEGRLETVFITPDVSGTNVSQLKVQDATHYWLDSILIQERPKSATMVANGVQRFVRSDTKVLAPMPVGQKLSAVHFSPAQYVKFFQVDFGRMAFQGLTEQVDAWGPLAGGLSSGIGGFNAAVSERSVRLKGRTYLSYKLSGRRTSAAMGNAAYEIVIDGGRYLPVSALFQWKDSKKRAWGVRWSAGYRFGQRFTAKDWVLRTSR